MIKELTVSLKADDGRSVTMAAQQASTIQTLVNTRKAGIASVIGYTPTTTSKWLKVPTHDIQLLTHISIPNLYKRRLESLQGIEFGDVISSVIAESKKEKSKFVKLTIAETSELFDTRKQQEIASLEKSLENFAGTSTEPLDNHREAHQRCYVHFGNVKVHLLTEDTPDDTAKSGKRKTPVIDVDGSSVILESIMIPYIELNVTERVKGERKPVNSGASVLMKIMIERAINKRSIQLKTLSLKGDNFEAFRIDGKELLVEDVARLGDLIAA